MTYRRRLLAKQQKRRNVWERQKMAILLDAEHLMERYEAAYREIYGRTPKIHYHRGWYKINGHCCRRADVETKISMLGARAHAREIEVHGDEKFLGAADRVEEPR